MASFPNSLIPPDLIYVSRVYGQPRQNEPSVGTTQFFGNVIIHSNMSPQGSGHKLDVAGSAHASSFPTSSDARFKTNVMVVTNVLEKLERVRAVSFEWNELYKSLGRSTGQRGIGLIAQEVEAVFPELVSTWGDEDYRAVDYGRLTAVLVEAIKELKTENEALKQRAEALERAIGER